jgi:hypothetical protein
MARASFWILFTAAALVGALLLLPRLLGPPQLGEAIGWTVVLYLVVLAAGAALRSHHEVLDALAFLLPLSVFQVVPDWLLAREFGVLVFPHLGGERVGPVPVYMAGLWVAPLLVVVWAAELAHRRSVVLAALTAVAVAVLLFGAAEWAARPLALWQARGVAMVQGVALYAVAAEAALGLAAWLAFTQVQDRAIPLKVLAAAGVSAFYAAAAVGFLVLSEQLA